MHSSVSISLLLAAGLGWAVSAVAAVDPGEILLAEMNCVACHAASAPVAARLGARQAPWLGTDGVRVTPQHLRAWLENPAAVKPGTRMPEVLQSLSPTAKTEAAEALTHYLLSLQPPDRKPPAAANPTIIETGRQLYHSVGCVACHAPQDLPAGAARRPTASAELAELQKASEPLGPLTQKYTVNELTAFLKDPLKTRPAGRMPGLKLSDPEARAIAMYLLREQVGPGAISRLPGLTYDYYEESLPELPEFDRLEPKATGTTTEFTLALAARKNDFALRFRGLLQIEREGFYTFFVTSDDGGRLFIDDQVVVENGGTHAPQEVTGRVKLKPGEHSLTLAFFQAGGDSALKVEWKPPGELRQAIPGNLLSHEAAPMRPMGEAPFVVDAAQAAKGAVFYVSQNCGSCHGPLPGGELSNLGAIAAKPLRALNTSQPSGCLAPQPPVKAPHFHLTDAQRGALLATLQNQATLDVPLTASDVVEHTLTALQCVACHQRGEHGGAEGLRLEYFRSAPGVDLGDEGRIPPHLGGVGAKLKTEWLRAVLVEGAAVRPYLATRMPQFGEANVRALPAAFAQADAALAGADPHFPTGEAAHDAEKIGRRLVGVGGLTCIACHTFAGHPSLGAPALDLTTATTRLQPDWFRRYLIDPQSLRPGTRMPSFWPGGVAANIEILGGETGPQIAAIWAYLGRGRDADLPAGLLHAKLELVADKEAVIYRNFITGGGPRAIGVGYPEKGNLAFDAEEMRVAEIWQGAFMDAGRHHTGRGEGFEPPLGVNVVKGPAGPAFALLAEPTAAWPQETGKAGGYQFRGYRLDEKQRPTFLYTFRGMEIEDFPKAVAGEPDASFQRTITLRHAQPPTTLYFRAAVAEKIEEQDGSFLVGGRVKLKFTGARAVVRPAEKGLELIVPVTFQGNEARFEEEISW